MTNTELAKLEGQRIAVFACKGERCSFLTSISVEGTLERHSKDRNAFRVVVSDGCYAYFKANEVTNLADADYTSITGCKAALKIDSTAL